MIGLLAPLGFAPLFIITTVTLIIATWQQQIWRRIPAPLLIMAAVVSLWTALTALWAVDPLRSLRSAAVLALMTGAGLWLMAAATILDENQRRWVLRCLLVGMVCAFAYVALDIACAGAITIWIKQLPSSLSADSLTFLARQNLGRGVIILVLMSWIAASAVSKRPVVSAIFIAVALVFALWSWSAAAKLAMAIGICAAALSAWRYLRPLALIALAALSVCVPLMAYNLPSPEVTATWRFMPFTNHHRLTIWGFTAKRIIEKPVLGWGMDSARDMPGGEERSVIWFKGIEVPEQLLPLHPHNGVLQWWLELGGIGVGLITSWLMIAAWRAYQPRPRLPFFNRSLGPALFSGAVLVGLVSFGFWQSWWQSFLWMAATWATIAWRSADQA